MGRSPSRLALLFVPLVFACFVLLPKARAVVPAPDGGYPGFTTAEGRETPLDLYDRLWEHSGWLVFAVQRHERQLELRRRRRCAAFQCRKPKHSRGRLGFIINSTGMNTANGVQALYNNTGTRTRPTVFKRSITTPPAAPTRPTVLEHSLATPPVAVTRPMVLMRSLPTPPVAVTRPLVHRRN